MTKFTTFKWFDADTLKGTAMEEPKEPLPYYECSPHCGRCEEAGVLYCDMDAKIQYKEELKKFNSSFIEFDKEEDRNKIFLLIRKKYSDGNLLWVFAIGKNYTLEEVEVEITVMCCADKKIRVDNQCAQCSDGVKVARIKKQQYGMPTNFENVKVFADGIKEETQEVETYNCAKCSTPLIGKSNTTVQDESLLICHSCWSETWSLLFQLIREGKYDFVKYNFTISTDLPITRKPSPPKTK